MSKNRRETGSRLPNGQFPRGATGNPNGRPRNDGKPANKHYSDADVKTAVQTALTEARLDGWYNLLSSLGTGKDKSTGGEIEVTPVSPQEARAIYRADSFGARIAEARPREMFRAGWKLKISDADVQKTRELQGKEGEPKKLSRQDARRIKRRLDALASKTKDLSERVMSRARDLEVNAKFKQALTLANVDGGCAILIGANDGQTDWSKPLNMEAIRRPEQLKWLTVIEERFLDPVQRYNNPRSEKYGQVAVWRINPQVDGAGVGVDAKFVPSPINVHESRLILFTGPKLTDGDIPGVRAGMGDSIYTRLKGTLSRYALGWNSAAILLNEFSLACMKIKGLADMASQDAQKKLMVRMAAVQLGRSIARVTLLDKEEELTRDTAAVTGLSDLLFALMQEMAGEADTPVTILMGMSPAGMNATGESDIRGWYDRIAGEWVEKLDPPMRRLLSIILRSQNGGKEPEKWSVDLNPLWQESPKEKAETRKIHADTDEQNIVNGIYSSEEARRSRYGGDEYGDEIVIDNEADLEIEKAAGEEDPDMAEAKKMKAEGALEVPKTGSEKPNLGSTPSPSSAPTKPGEKPAPAGNPGDTIPINAPETAASNAAFTGVQISSMLEVIKAAIAEEIPREAAKAILMVGFPVTDAQAEDLLGPVGFKPKKEDPPPMPGGFGGPPKPPIAPPNGAKPPIAPPKPPVPPKKGE
jgi:phage-related protein (TIGR01555 family)